MPRARIISFVNYKGGVGKTSLVVNIAACLALAKKRALVVDCDPQSNASIWMMRLDRWNAVHRNPEHSLFGMITDPGVTARGCIVPNVIQDTEGTVLLPGLDLLPTCFNLMDLDHEFVPPEDAPPPYVSFTDKLLEVADNYDYILLDCPPNTGLCTQSALFCSDSIFVPANPDALSLIGFSLFVDKAIRFHQRSRIYRNGRSPAMVNGIILNAVKPNARIDVPVERMRVQLDRFRKSGRVAPHACILEPAVRNSVTMGRSVLKGLPIVFMPLDKEDNSIRSDLQQLASAIQRQLDKSAIPTPALT